MPTAPVIVRNITDAGNWSKYPTTNYNNVVRNGIANAHPSLGTSEVYYYFGIPFPKGATIVSAKLVFFQVYNYTGSVTMTAKRCWANWSSTRLTWNNKPAVDTTASFSATKASPLGGTRWEIDIKAMMQTVSNGGVWPGLQITTSASTPYNYIHSPQAANTALRPYVEIVWADTPQAPTTLSPSSGRAVSLDKPTLSFNFTDVSGDTTMNACQVQINPTNTFTAPAFDSGTVLTSVPELNLAGTAYAGLAAGSTAWWRVRVQDGAGLWSAWSTPTSFVRQLKGTLTLNNPPSGVVRTNLSPNPAYRGVTGTTTVRQNRVMNPSVRDNASYWSQNGGTNTVSAVRVVGGGPTVPSGQVLNRFVGTVTAAGASPNGASTGPSIGSPGADQVTVVAGKVTNYSVYYRTSRARSVSLVITYADAAGVAVGVQIAGPSIAITANTWTRLSHKDTPPAGATRATIRVYPTGTNVDWQVNDTWEATGWLVESDASVAFDYFDGDTPNAWVGSDGSGWTSTWVGTPGASYSSIVGAAVNVGSPRAYSTFSWYGAKDGTDDAYRMVYLGGAASAGALIAWLDAATGLPIMNPGEYYSARIQMRIVSGGQPMTVNPRIAIYQPSFHSNITDIANDVVTIQPDGQWVDLLATASSAVPSGLTSPTPRTMLYLVGAPPPAGTVVELRYHMIEKVSGAGVDAGPYFDGDTGDVLDSMDYSWVGTANNSASTLSRSYVSEATPIVDWTYAGNGRTQKAYAVTVTDAERTEKRLWTTGKITGSTSAVTIPAGVIKTNTEDYRVIVTIWDEIDRETTPNDPLTTTVSRTFQFVYDATINVVTGLTAAQASLYPWTYVTWRRDTMPDKWNIYKNGKLLKVYNGQDLLLTPGDTLYRFWDYKATPRKQDVYAAIPVVNGKGASGNPSVGFTNQPITLCLTDSSGLYPVMIFEYDYDADLQEESGMFTPAGDGPPVLIHQADRGYQGSVQGQLIDYKGVSAETMLSNFKRLKKNNGTELILTAINDAYDVVIYNATFKPIAGPGWVHYIVKFDFFQTDYTE